MALFTPRTAEGERLRLDVSDSDIAKIERGHEWCATVTDRPTGVRYMVKGAPCRSPHCFCDALVIRALGVAP